jgi:hypothetical protein
VLAELPAVVAPEADDGAAIARQGLRSAQTMQVGPCTPVGIQLQQAEVGPTSGPTRRPSHLS